MKPLTLIWILVSTFLAAISLSACDSGGSPSSNAAQDDPTDDDDTDNLVAYSGKVADGYIVGATVCLDINRNGRCDADEPSTISTGGGNYTLDLDPELVDEHPVVVEVGPTAYDEDTSETFNGTFRLTAPVGHGGFVSPLTTLVAAQMQNDSSLTPEQAEELVLVAMGYAPNSGLSLFEDYIERRSEPDYQVQHRVAQGLTKLLIEAEKKLVELESETSLSEIDSVQSQQSVIEFLGASVGELAVAAVEGKTMDSVVANWSEQIQQEIDSELILSSVSRASLLSDRQPVNLYEYVQDQQENSFIMNGNYIATWQSDFDNGELSYTTMQLNTSTGVFEPGNFDQTILLFGSSGKLIRTELYSEQIDMVDDYPEQDGMQRIVYVDKGDGTLHRLMEHLDQGQQVDIGGLNLWRTLSSLHPSDLLQPIHKGLFEPDAILSADAKAVLVKRRFVGEPVWTMNYHTDCSAERLVEIGEMDEPDLMDNCSIAWLQGLDWRSMSSNTLADAMNSTAYVPVADPVQNSENLHESVSSHVMVDMGEHRAKPYSGRNGEKYTQVLVEIIGEPGDNSGPVNWYIHRRPLQRFIEFSDRCQDWDELWALVKGNCSVPWFVQHPLNEDYEVTVPSSFEEMFAEEPLLDVGVIIAANSLNNLGRSQAIFEIEGYYGELLNYEGLAENQEYSEFWAGEMIDNEDGNSGTLAMYRVTRADTVTPLFWDWDCEELTEIAALSGNCAVAQNFDYSEPFSLSDQMSEAALEIDDWTLSSNFPNTAYYDFGELTDPVSGDASCLDGNDDSQAFSGVMVGSPSDDAGQLLVFEGRFLESDECEGSVRKLASLPWEKKIDGADSVFYQIDISSLVSQGKLSSYHGDWDNDNPGFVYLAVDGEVLRPAQLTTRDNIVERLDIFGEWMKVTTGGEATIEFDLPEQITNEADESVEYSLVIDDGLVRPRKVDEVQMTEPLGVTTQWHLRDLGNAQVIEIERPKNMPGLYLWGHGITDVGTRIRRVQNHTRRFENDNKEANDRTWYSLNVIEQVRQQVKANYSAWSLQ